MKGRVVILGAGESGTGSALLAKSRGLDTFISDSGAIREQYRRVLEDNGVPFEEGGHSPDIIAGAKEIIKSPGIPPEAPVVQAAVEAGIPVISEIDFAARYTDAVKIAITGSNGKTTTTHLIYDILKRAGKRVAMTGNVGNSFALAVKHGGYDYYVIEMSSFQLDNSFSFKADIAILLNITPDHLDRYENDLSRYVDSKFRIVNNQRAEDIFICAADDATISAGMDEREIKSQILRFSLVEKSGMAAYLDSDDIVIEYNRKKSRIMTIYDLALRGRHNAYNSMASAIAGRVLGISKETIRESLAGFKGVEHRLEPVITVCGIHFINDSKATNVNSTWYALESLPPGIVWIAGGVDKGNDYSELLPLVKEKVSALVCLGKDNDKLQSYFEGVVKTVVSTGSMEDAVRSAYYLARRDETVLLSPACASFDLFANYEERGRLFKQVVRDL